MIKLLNYEGYDRILIRNAYKKVKEEFTLGRMGNNYKGRVE